MNCPFCGTKVNSSSILCRECKFDLPEPHLISIYTSILNRNRDLGKVENRKKLNALALKEYKLRQDLAQEAIAAELARKEVKALELAKLKEAELEAKSQRKEIRKQRIQSSYKFVAIALVVVLICGSYLLKSSISKKSELETQCQELNTLINPSSARQGSFSEVIDYFANLSANRSASNYDFIKSSTKAASLGNEFSQATKGMKLPASRIYLRNIESRLEMLRTTLSSAKTGAILASLKVEGSPVSLFIEQSKESFLENSCTSFSDEVSLQFFKSEGSKKVTSVFLLASPQSKVNTSTSEGSLKNTKSAAQKPNLNARQVESIASAQIMKKLKSTGINCQLRPLNNDEDVTRCDLTFDQGEVFDTGGKSYGQGGVVTFYVRADTSKAWLDKSISEPDRLVRNYCSYWDGKDYLGVYGFFKTSTAVVTKDAIFAFGIIGQKKGFSLWRDFEKWKPDIINKITTNFRGEEICTRVARF